MFRNALLLIVCGCAAVAAGQQPEFKIKPLPKLPRPEVPPPALTRPDTTLLDDTDAGGLTPRLREIPAEANSPIPLPLGKRCVVETVRGKEHEGILEEMGDWVVLRLDGNRRAWLAARRVVAIIEAHGPAENSDGADRRRNEPKAP